MEQDREKMRQREKNETAETQAWLPTAWHLSRERIEVLALKYMGRLCIVSPNVSNTNPFLAYNRKKFYLNVHSLLSVQCCKENSLILSSPSEVKIRPSLSGWLAGDWTQDEYMEMFSTIQKQRRQKQHSYP